MTEFGAEIVVNGKRPDWLKDDRQTVFRISSRGHEDWIGTATTVAWGSTRAIKLPAYHPYYKATEAGYKYWPGGDKAPDNWNGGTVLLRDGRTICHGGMSWSHFGETAGAGNGDIIGYQQSKGPAIRLEGSAPPSIPAPFQGMTPTMINAMIVAVKAGDITAAQALVVDPVVLRAREICRKHALYPVEPNSAFENAVVEALRESNRPTEQDVLKLARVAAYTVHLHGGIDMTGASTDYLAGKRDDESIAALVVAIRNAI